ncbi:tRNA (adenosine(37)-N6)-dimethylallyltransferase MiaA [Desulfonatronum parangueonense]
MPSIQTESDVGEASRIICLVGATGTGKTAGALALARHYPVTVINADSRQVYRDVPIITAQPDNVEQSVCPHRLYGFLDMRETISAGRFMDEARRELAACRKQGRLPVLVGGTGLYLRALGGGLADIPDVPGEIREEVLRCCAEQGPEILHARLMEVDPEYGVKIHPRDRQRVCRALEVHQASGRPLSWWHAHRRSTQGLELFIVGLRLDRRELHQRLAIRIDQMLELGAVREIEQAWHGCPDRAAPGFSGIGCRELLDYCSGATTLDQAKDLWLFRTRAYAKRQETWFNNIPEVQWVRAGDEQELLRCVARQKLNPS